MFGIREKFATALLFFTVLLEMFAPGAYSNA
jgi:hypothetical protein